MIGTDQDVMNTRGYELADYRQHALAGSRKILGLRMVDVENHLRSEGIALIDIYECLMLRIIGKHLCGNRHHTGRCCRARITEMKSHGLAFL